MKKAILVLLLCLGVLWGTLNKGKMSEAWSKVENQVSGFLGNKTLDEELGEGEPEEEDAPAEEPAPKPRKTPAVAQEQMPEAPPSLPLLPEGQYYTRERIVETTDTGLSAIAAGRLVKKVGEKDGKLWIEDPEKATRVYADPWKLTQNPAEAPGVIPPVTEESKQASSRKRKTSAERAAEAKARMAERDAQVQAEIVAVQEATLKREKVREQIKGLNRHISAVQGELNAAVEKQRRASISGYGPTIARLNKQLEELRNQRTALYKALDDIR